jgi:hypothetical protein
MTAGARRMPMMMRGSRGARYTAVLAAILAGTLTLASAAEAKGEPKGVAQEEVAAEAADPGGWHHFQAGWQEFVDFAWAQILISFLVAIILGAALAYHPRSFGKASTLEEVEQPKIYLMYAVVGALIGQICGHSTTMAYVIFGLGGLFRFRTDVGPARDTGRLILVTLVGVLCGLMKPVPAVLATAVGWVLIYLLESRVAHRLTVKGLEPQVLAESASAYRSVIEELGISILSEKKNFVKKQVAFVFRVAGGLDVDDLTEELKAGVRENLQGAIDWESS